MLSMVRIMGVLVALDLKLLLQFKEIVQKGERKQMAIVDRFVCWAGKNKSKNEDG